MSENYIGRLQEYCQQNKLNIPTYNVKNVGGTSHMPKFRCIVHIGSDCFKSSAKPNAKAAKQDGACIALQTITGEALRETMQMVVKQDTREEVQRRQVLNVNGVVHDALFVDCENLPNFINEIQQLRDTNPDICKIDLYGFTSSNHPQSRINEPWMRVVDSNAPNACDTAMIMFISDYLYNNPHINVYLATTDIKFANGLRDALLTNFLFTFYGTITIISNCDHWENTTMNDMPLSDIKDYIYDLIACQISPCLIKDLHKVLQRKHKTTVPVRLVDRLILELIDEQKLGETSDGRFYAL